MEISWMMLVVVACLVVQAFAPAEAAGHTRQSTAPLAARTQHPPCSLLCWARRQLGESKDWGGLRQSFNDWNRTDARQPTQAAAYSNSDGPDQDDEPGFPFTAYSTEPSSLAPPSGTYYHTDGDQALALDPQIGAWGGNTAYSSHPLKGGGRYKFRPTFKRQNPQRSDTVEGDNSTTVSHFTLEYGDQRGTQALAGTFEGARAAAGSHTAFNLARKDSIGGASYASNNDAYGPTPGRPTLVQNGDRHSVAFTDLPPNSAAVAGTGYGPVATAAGWEVAATARSGRDPLLPAEARPTLGHRPRGENGLLDSGSSRGLRGMLQHLAPVDQWPRHAEPGATRKGAWAFGRATQQMLLQFRHRLRWPGLFPLVSQPGAEAIVFQRD